MEIFAIFEEVFGSSDRLVKVLPGFAGWPHMSEQIIEALNNPSHLHSAKAHLGSVLIFSIEPILREIFSNISDIYALFLTFLLAQKNVSI